MHLRVLYEPPGSHLASSHIIFLPKGFLELWSIPLLYPLSWILHASNISTMRTLLPISAIHWRYAWSTFCCSHSGLYTLWQMNLGRHLPRQFSNSKSSTAHLVKSPPFLVNLHLAMWGSYTPFLVSQCKLWGLLCADLALSCLKHFSLCQPSLFISLLPTYYSPLLQTWVREVGYAWYFFHWMD